MLKADVVNLKKEMTEEAQAVFQLYSNLLTEEACQPWDFIVKEQMEVLPYTNISIEWKK